MKPSLYFASLLSFLLVTLIAGSPHFAWGGPSPVAPVNTTDGLALQGYDPVAYFALGKPTPGVNQFIHGWQGTT